MACEIEFGTRSVLLNNRQFSALIDCVIEIADKLAGKSDVIFVERMKKMRDDVFWPGRGINILEDFSDIDDQKFWSQMFYETARAIFLREVGVHEHTYWQAQRISQAYQAGRLFEEAVRSTEPKWDAKTTDRKEFDRIVNNQTEV